MVRTPRRDRPNRIHHVMNRGARRQVLFADRRDFRRFLAILACSVRRGELQVLAFCLMGTHFHLLARSLGQGLSYALMRTQNAYARYRNRRARQDGSLFRGRFISKPVTSRRYLRTLIRYIDHNPVQASLCRHPFEYPYGSARHFAAGVTPPWLDPSAVRRFLAADVSRPDVDPEAYARAFGAPISASEVEIIERRLARPRAIEDELDQLYASPPEFIARWMARKVGAAGGRSPWIPVAGSSCIIAAVRQLKVIAGDWRVVPRRKGVNGWDVAVAGLLSTLACMSIDEIAKVLRCHRSTVAGRVRTHRSLMLSDADYQERMGSIARDAMDRTFAV